MSFLRLFGLTAAVATIASSSFNGAFAGVDTSGGGNAVVCFISQSARESVRDALEKMETSGINAVNPFARTEIMDQVVSVESLDLYLHQMPRGRNSRGRLGLPTFPDGMAANQIIESLLQRLDKKNSLADEIRSMDSVLSEGNWLAAAGVARIADSGLPILMPDNCLVAQLAHRRGNQVFFDQYLYEKMPEIHKAGLILHELLYRMAKDAGAQDAYQVYQVMSLIFLPEEDFQGISATDLTSRMVHLFGTSGRKLRAKQIIHYAGVEFEVWNYVDRDGVDLPYNVSNVVKLPLGSLQLNLIDAELENARFTKGQLTSGKLTGKYADDVFVNFLSDQSLSLKELYLNSEETCRAGSECGFGTIEHAGGTGSHYSFKRFNVNLIGEVRIHFYKEQLDLRASRSNNSGAIEVNGWVDDRILVFYFKQLTVSGDGQQLLSGTLAEDLKLGWNRKIEAGSLIRFDEKGSPILR